MLNIDSIFSINFIELFYYEFINLLPSSWLIPILWPIMCAIVPASKWGSYVFKSTLIPIDLGVHTVSGTATPDSPPWNDSPLQKNK